VPHEEQDEQKSFNRFSQASVEKRKAVLEWRARKAQEAMVAEKEKQKQETMQVEEEAKKRAMQRSKQEAVALYRLEKEQRTRHEAQVKEALESSETCHKFSPAELRERRKIDVINARRKREEVLSKKQAVESRAQVLEEAAKRKRDQINERVSRDPNRATKNTESSTVKNE
jgi:hypothetical protein